MLPGQKFKEAARTGLKEVEDQLKAIVAMVAKMNVVQESDTSLENHVAAMEASKDEALNVIDAAAQSKKRVVAYLATKMDHEG